MTDRTDDEIDQLAREHLTFGHEKIDAFRLGFRASHGPARTEAQHRIDYETHVQACLYPNLGPAVVKRKPDGQYLAMHIETMWQIWLVARMT